MTDKMPEEKPDRMTNKMPEGIPEWNVRRFAR